jgi:MFS family permease
LLKDRGDVTFSWLVSKTCFSVATNTSQSNVLYTRYLLFIAGMGGLLCGIIAEALLHLEKTISLTVGETSIIVAAVLGGSMFSSVVAGVLADWFGRKTMMMIRKAVQDQPLAETGCR